MKDTTSQTKGPSNPSVRRPCVRVSVRLVVRPRVRVSVRPSVRRSVRQSVVFVKSVEHRKCWTVVYKNAGAH